MIEVSLVLPVKVVSGAGRHAGLSSRNIAESSRGDQEMALLDTSWSRRARLLRVAASSKRWFDTDTQRHCAARRAGEHTPRGAMPLRAGQLRR